MLLNTDQTRAIIEDRAKKVLDELEKKLDRGEISSQADLLANIENDWRNVFSVKLGTSVEVPDFRYGELPIKSMLEDPVFSAENDINTLWDQLGKVRSGLRDLFNRVQSENISISNLIGTVQNKTSQFQLFSSDSESLFLWSSDSFTSYDKVDREATTAFVDISNGIAMLSATSLDSLLKYVTKLTIDHGNSYGIPGNNMEIASEGGPSSPDDKNPEPQVTLVGKTDLRSQVSYMFDSQPNTWMEWEMNFVPRYQKCKAIGTAWHKDAAGQNIDVIASTNDTSNQPAGWRKFVQWPGSAEYDRGPDGKGYYIANFTEDKPAKLVFTLEFDQPRKISTIQISPQILGGSYPIVRQISVSREGDSGYTRTVVKDAYLTSKLNESLKANRAGVPEGNYTGTGIWTIPDKEIKYINFSLESGVSYVPDLGLGHHYYFRIIDKRSEIKIGFVSFVSHKQLTERLPNPDEGVSTGSKNNSLATVGELAGLILGGVVGGAIGQIAGSLLSWGSSTSVVRQGDAWDVFDGRRGVIGIKDIDISIREYAQESIIVSTPHYFVREISAVSIISTEEIPDGWDTNTEWISYEVSTDGHTWQKIVPQNRSKGDSDTVFVTGTRVLVRITLKRPADKPNESPILKHYAIKALPKT
jgi:hypothetical protein